MTLRAKRQLITVAYYGIVIFLCLVGIGLGEACGSPDLSALSVLVLLAHILTPRFNPLPRLIQQRLLQEANCPACGEAIDLVQTWSCSCRYAIWVPRHAFSPCRNCKKVFSWIVCPVCEASITI